MKITAIFLSLILILSSNVYAGGTDGITVTAQAAASSVNITTTQTNLVIATLNLTTSGTNGTAKSYNLNVQSQYGGLRNTAAVTKGATTLAATIPYNLSWTTTAGTINTQNALTVNATTAQTLMTKTDNTSSNNPVAGSLNFSITGKPAASLFSGTYSDTLTITWTNTWNNTTITRTMTVTAAVVADTITLTVTPTASASNLPLTVSQSNLNVGTVSITANCLNGYKLELASAYSRQLRNTQVAASPQATEKIDYTMTFNGTAVSPTPTPVTVASSSSATLITTTTQIGNVNISYTGVSASVWKSGTYEDYLTFTLTSQ